MKNLLKQWTRRLSVSALAATAALVSCSSLSTAAPDYDQIGKQFSLVLQNAHFSRARFTFDRSRQFLDCYLQTLDPQHLYFTQQDVDALREKYATSFGDYLLASQSTQLAEELYAAYSERALRRIGEAEAMLKAYADKMPTFDTDRTIPRSRRKLPRAKDDAELDLVWRDQVQDMILSETIRRENVARLAAEKGKPDPNAKEKSVTEKLLARMKRMRSEVQEADLEDMVSHVLNAVAHVYDPHSDYMGAREEQRFKDMIKASIVGIGARLKADDDGTTVVEGIVKGGPAAKSGQIQLGDRIVAVDTESNDNWTDIMYLSIDKVVDLIRGKQGKAVSMRVQSAESGEEKVVTIVRDEVPMSEELASARVVDMKVPAADGTVKDYRLGILTLPSFYVDLDDGDVHCAADVKDLLRRMVKEGVQGLVLDLRYNGGGSLDEVRKMVGFFTGMGPVVQVKDSRGHVEKLTVSCRPCFKGEMVVMINKLSASASEIFAGAMVDYGRAVVVGDTTSFGKGTVQVPRELGDYMPYFSSREGSGMIKVTTQQFYRVGGASTQLKGVPSDIVLPTITAGFQLGEAEQDYAMPYDEIAKASGYVKSSRLGRILPWLRERSAARVAEDRDLQYVKEEVERARERQEKNRISLNKATREAENAKLLARKKAMDAERKQRYEKLAAEDAKNLVIRRLNLTDVDAETLPIATKEDEDKFMDEAVDPEAELEEAPEYPSSLDPELRESMNILVDMINS